VIPRASRRDFLPGIWITAPHKSYEGTGQMINLISSTLIERPVKQVFDFVSTPENDFQWQYGTLATASLSKGSHTMQTFFRSIGHLLGRRNLSTFEVTEFEPNKKYGFKSLSGPFHSQTSYVCELANGNTKITISTQVNVVNFFHMDEGFLEKRMKKQLEENLAMLKDLLEAQRNLPAAATVLLTNPMET
jgi:Polyketide cyclase / dehydrase and lipid transport